jgi:predicted kinase
VETDILFGMEKKIIYLLGRSCSGKSTISKKIKQQLPGIYNVSYDTMKWQLAGYSRDKDRALIKSIVKDLFELICSKSIPVLYVSWFRDEKEFLEHKNIESKYGYKSISVELTAPEKVLLSRFRERVNDVKKTSMDRISVTDENIFLKNLHSGEWFTPAIIKSFDTSVLSPDAIAEEIVRLFTSL